MKELIMPEAMAKFSEVSAFTSTRGWGNLDTRTGDPVARSNLQELCQHLNICQTDVIKMEQIHHGVVTDVSSSQLGETIIGVDGIVTNETGIFLSVVTADCQPVLLFDPVEHAIGAIHVGWKSNVAGIIDETIDALGALYNVKPENLRVFIGPSLCVAHSRFSNPRRELPSVFHQFIVDEEKAGSTAGYVDWRAASRKQFLLAGVPVNQVEIFPACTACDTDTFFSLRGDRSIEGEQISLIGLR